MPAINRFASFRPVQYVSVQRATQLRLRAIPIIRQRAQWATAVLLEEMGFQRVDASLVTQDGRNRVVNHSPHAG